MMVAWLIIEKDHRIVGIVNNIYYPLPNENDAVVVQKTCGWMDSKMGYETG